MMVTIGVTPGIFSGRQNAAKTHHREKSTPVGVFIYTLIFTYSKIGIYDFYICRAIQPRRQNYTLNDYQDTKQFHSRIFLI